MKRDKTKPPTGNTSASKKRKYKEVCEYSYTKSDKKSRKYRSDNDSSPTRRKRVKEKISKSNR